MIDITVCILLFIQTYLFTQHRTYFLTSTTKALTDKFLPEDYETIQDNQQGHYTFYFSDIDDVINDIKKTTDDYNSFVKDNVDTFFFVPNSTINNSNDPSQLKVKSDLLLDVTLFKTDIGSLFNESSPTFYWSDSTVKFKDILTEEKPFGNYLSGQFSTEEKKKRFFNNLKEMEISFTLQSVNLVENTTPDFLYFFRLVQCIEWKLTKLYDFKSRGGRIATIFHYRFLPCSNIKNTFFNFFQKFYKIITWVNLMVYVLSTISLFLNLKSIFHRHSLYMKFEIKKKKIKKRRDVENKDVHISFIKFGNIIFKLLNYIKIPTNDGNGVSFLKIPNFISPWIVLTISANLTNITAAVLCFVNSSYDLPTSFFLGFGVLIEYINLVRYFKFAPQYYLLILTLKRGLKGVIYFFIGVIPVFVGFALFGTIVFGHYAEYFEDIDDTSATLFSILNGDAMHTIFDMLWGYNPFLAYSSRIYMYIFVLFFICVVLNIFILIMEDAFFSLSEESQQKEEELKKRKEQLKNEQYTDINIATLNDSQIDDMIEYHNQQIQQQQEEEMEDEFYDEFHDEFHEEFHKEEEEENETDDEKNNEIEMESESEDISFEKEENGKNIKENFEEILKILKEKKKGNKEEKKENEEIKKIEELIKKFENYGNSNNES